MIDYHHVIGTTPFIPFEKETNTQTNKLYHLHHQINYQQKGKRKLKEKTTNPSPTKMLPLQLQKKEKTIINC